MTTVVSVKVKFIRPEYDNFREWLQNSNNIYIGRGGRIFINKEIFHYKESIWKNPYSVKKYGREKSLELYEIYLKSNPDLMDKLSELKGKTLGCWCKPEKCHGDILLKYIQIQVEND